MLYYLSFNFLSKRKRGYIFIQRDFIQFSLQDSLLKYIFLVILLHCTVCSDDDHDVHFTVRKVADIPSYM